MNFFLDQHLRLMVIPQISTILNLNFKLELIILRNKKLRDSERSKNRRNSRDKLRQHKRKKKELLKKLLKKLLLKKPLDLKKKNKKLKLEQRKRPQIELLQRQRDLRNKWQMPTRMIQNILQLESNMLSKLLMSTSTKSNKKNLKSMLELRMNSIKLERRDTKILKLPIERWNPKLPP